MPRKRPNLTIFIQEKEVKTGKTFKYLGSLFDTKGGAEKDVKIAWSAPPLVSNNEPRYLNVFPVFTSFS